MSPETNIPKLALRAFAQTAQAQQKLEIFTENCLPTIIWLKLPLERNYIFFLIFTV